jgi:hypothetical protein
MCQLKKKRKIATRNDAASACILPAARMPGVFKAWYALNHMKQTILVFISLMISLPVLGNTSHIISNEQWSVPRSAEVVIQMPAIRQAVQEMQATPHSHLLIRYPGGDEGTLWLSELRSWLVSLGIPSQLIETTPGSELNQIELEVITPLANPGISKK